MATSDEQFGGSSPYNPGMTSLPVAELLRLAGAAAGGRSPVGPCLDEVDLARLADHSAGPDERTAAISHLVTCDFCRRQLAALTALLADPAIAAEAAPPREAKRRPGLLVAAAMGVVALAASLLLVVLPRGGLVPDTHRDPTLTAIPAPHGFQPAGDVTAAPLLVWSSVDGATRYRATIFDSAGTVLLEVQTPDTTAVIPDSVSLVRDRQYFWKVEARTGWDHWAASDLVRFRLMSSSTPHAARPLPWSRSSLAVGVAQPAGGHGGPVATEVPRWALARRAAEGRGDAYEAIRRVFGEVVRGDQVHRGERLEEARRIAIAHQAAWGDGFLRREVERFGTWPPLTQAAKVRADSVRAAGNVAYGRDGPRAAIAVWQGASALAASVPDTAGLAASLGNIGAAYAREALRDSAARYLVRAAQLGQAVGDHRVTANALSELAGLIEKWGDTASARAQYAKAIALRQGTGDARGLAADYNNTASLARAAGEFDVARRQLEAALAINRTLGSAGATATNLVNLGSLAASVGAFQRADDDYREALAIWLDLADSAEAASALSGLGELGLRRGDYRAAAESYAAATAILDRTGPSVDAVVTRQGLASALAAQGMLQSALDVLRRANEVAAQTGIPPEVRAANALARADLAAQLNRFPEAEALYATAVALYERARVPQGVASARHGQGALYLAQGDHARARATLQTALQSQLAGRDLRGAAVTRVALAGAAGQAGEIVRARGYLARAVSDFDRLHDPVGGAAALGQLADLELDAGRLAAADSLYRGALRQLEGRVAPEIRWRLHAGLADVYARAGRAGEAVRALRESIAELERTGATLGLPEKRSAWRADKWAPYQRLSALELGRGEVAASFLASEAIRAREMLELLAMGRVAAPRDTVASLVAREQDLRRRIGELTQAVEATASERGSLRGPDVAGAGVSPRRALIEAQAEYVSLQQEIRERAPRHAALVTPEPISWRQVAGRLQPHEAMVEYLLGDTTSFAFVITRDTLAAVALDVGHDELARRIDFARRTMQPHSGVLDQAWRTPLRELYRELIEPVEGTGLLSGKSRLIVIPHAELHYLPFAALLAPGGEGHFLIQRYQIALTPAAAVWLAVGRRPGQGGSGVLALAPHPDRLPASRGEINALRRLGGSDVVVLSGAAATEAAFGREAPRRRLIHLATYGVLNKQNPLFSFVDLAPDRAHDGRLEAHEVFGYSLSADLVVLAACQTGLAAGAWADVPAGDDWVGLARAFLTSGARSVVASLWAVDDRATGELMQRFYGRFAEDPDPAGALTEAMRAMLSRPETGHPYYWAGFEVLGGR